MEKIEKHTRILIAACETLYSYAVVQCLSEIRTKFMTKVNQRQIAGHWPSSFRGSFAFVNVAVAAYLNELIEEAGCKL